MFYFRKEASEGSKNNTDVDENLGVTGIIPFQSNTFGCNPGETVELYLSLLDPESEFLFQRPRRPSKAFNAHGKDTEVYYEKVPVGQNELASMMKELSKKLGLRPFTNHCIRATAIENHPLLFHKVSGSL